MLNIFGLALALIGSLVSMITVMTSKYDNKGTTHNQLKNMGKELRNQKIASIIGFFLMFLGFLLQLISSTFQIF